MSFMFLFCTLIIISKVNVILVVFFDIRGLVHHEFVPEGHTVNKEYYLAALKRLREKICQKRLDMWKNNSWFYTTIIRNHKERQLWPNLRTKNATNSIDHLPYSPYLASCGFFLFQKLILPLRGTRFDSIEAVKQNLWKELKAIPESAYKKCFEDWKNAGICVLHQMGPTLKAKK